MAHKLWIIIIWWAWKLMRRGQRAVEKWKIANGTKQSHLPYAKRLSFSWSPNVSHNRSDTLTPSTTSHDRSSTSLWIRYWSIAQTVGMCVCINWLKSSRELHARAQMSRVLPTAVSPTTTHLTNSWWACSLSMVIFIQWWNKSTQVEGLANNTDSFWQVAWQIVFAVFLL